MAELSDLIRCQNPRLFLRKALEIKYSRQGKINISDFSRKAGFTSRSFLTEYLAEKKRLSPESFRKIRSALKLPKDYLQLFSLLVSRDQPDLKIIKSINIHDDLQQFPLMLEKKEKVIEQIKDPNQLIKKKYLYIIFAALGSPNNGASLKEISNRTNLSSSVIENGLQLLLGHNVIYLENQRFFAKSEKIDFMDLRTIELAHLAQDMCQEISAKSEKIVANDTEFIFYSALSIESKNILNFKNSLRDSIYSVLDQYQNDDGDSVQQVFFCLKK